MASDEDISALPSESSLCFKKDEFIQENFSVDNFVSERRKCVSLDKLRDDLGIYLRVLHSAMIELINKDYADFVNLSSNLVGLDKSLKNLSTPLGQLKEEVLSVSASLNEALESALRKLKEREITRTKKMLLQRVMFIIISVEKIEDLLNISSCSHNEKEDSLSLWSGELVERVSLELNEIQFNLRRSQCLPLIEQTKPRIIHIVSVLENYLDHTFLEALIQEDGEKLDRILRIYATIGKIKEVESLFCRKLVQPYMQKVITEKAVYEDGIQSMYNQVLEFIPSKCKMLLELITGSHRTTEAVNGYDFLVNSVWTEIACCLESIRPSVFAPGNPTLFHKHYSATLIFLEQFELSCTTKASVQRLREHPSYKSFMEKWNLPIYFQIRFQEMGGALENSLLSPFESANGDAIFLLNASGTLCLNLHLCWSENVFLKSLAHKFWKLTLQLLSRYHTWIDASLKNWSSQSSEDLIIDSCGQQNLANFNSSWESKVINSISDSCVNETDSHPSVLQLLMLVRDIEQLQIHVPLFFKEVIMPKLQKEVKYNSDIQENLEESLLHLNKLLPKIGTLIQQDIISQCSLHLKLVTDIPRLYRKTNREIPSKPSAYVTNILKPFENFLQDSEKLLSVHWRNEWIQQILSGITQQYLAVTGDVLTSLKKMEDSLKRLKRARDKTITTAVSGGISDDEKIRLQLVLDVENFGQKIDLLGQDKSNVQGYGLLVELVESARISPSANS